MISASYTQPLWTTYNRREHLKMSKCFWCRCARCQDPTEFGSYLSCLNCVNCGGKVLSTDPLDQAAKWKCQTCNKSMEGSDVKATNDSILASLKATDRSDPDALDAFLKDHAVTLPDR